MEHKCEIVNCNVITDSYLCEGHRKQLEKNDSILVICEECNSILRFDSHKIRARKTIYYGTGKTIIAFRYVKKEKCPYCKIWKGNISNE